MDDGGEARPVPRWKHGHPNRSGVPGKAEPGVAARIGASAVGAAVAVIARGIHSTSCGTPSSELNKSAAKVMDPSTVSHAGTITSQR